MIDVPLQKSDQNESIGDWRITHSGLYFYCTTVFLIPLFQVGSVK